MKLWKINFTFPSSAVKWLQFLEQMENQYTVCKEKICRKTEELVQYIVDGNLRWEPMSTHASLCISLPSGNITFEEFEELLFDLEFLQTR